MRWYAAILVVLVAALAFAASRYQRLGYSAAEMAVVSLRGPTDTVPGTRARFAVLVRDREGAPVPDASVRIGFERNGFDELATGKTGLAGDATLDVPIPGNFAVGEARLLRVHADTAIGRAQDESWIVPRAPAYAHLAVTTDQGWYRPGDTIHVRAILERAEGEPASERIATIRVERDRDGTTLFRVDEKTSTFGMLTADLPVAEEMATGDYSIHVTLPPIHDLLPATAAGGCARIRVERSANPKPETGEDPHVVSFGIEPEGGTLIAGTTQTLLVRVHGGSPESRVVRAVGHEAPVTKGIAKLTLTVPSTDFEVEVTDGHGHGDTAMLHPEPRGLVIHADAETFTGEAPVTVYGAPPGERVVLEATKDDTIIAWQTAQRTADGVAFRVPLRKDVRDAVWLDAVSLPSGLRGRRSIAVTAPELHVKLTPTSDSVAVDVADADGKAVKAELGVVAIEEGAPSTEADPGPSVAKPRKHDSRVPDREAELLRWRAWLIVLLALCALVTLSPFLGAALDQLTRSGRRAEALPKEERERRWLLLLAVSAAFITALVLPPIVAMAYQFLASNPAPHTVVTIWAIVACLLALNLPATLRRSQVSLTLAPGLLFIHAACVITFLDRGAALARFFDIAEDRHALPLLLLALVQLVLVCLGVLRLTRTEPTTIRDRRVRFTKSAFVTGLPITLAVLAYGAYLHIHAANLTWREYAVRHDTAGIVERNQRAHAEAKRDVTEGRSAAPEPELRGRFYDTLVWQPHLVTDDKGHADVPVAYTKASASSYRFEVNAIDRNGLRGKNATSIGIKQAFSARARPPAELTRGDEIALPVTVLADPTSSDDVRLTMSGEGFATVTKRFKIAAGEAHHETLLLKAERAGTRTLRIEAVGTKARDAIESNVDVLPNAYRLVNVFNEMKTTMALTRTLQEDGNDLYLNVCGGPAGLLSGNLDVTYASVLAMKSPELEVRARRELELAAERLALFEPESPIPTAQALVEVTDLASVISVDPAIAKRLREWLTTKSTSPVVAWAAGSPFDPSPNNAFELALAANGPNPGPWLDALATSSIKDEYGVHWGTTGGVRDVEATAFAAHALARSGKHEELAKGGRAWLAAHRQANAGWRTAAATTAALRALNDDMPAAPKESTEVSVLVDGAVIDTYRFEKKNRDAAHRVDLRKFATGEEHRFEVRSATPEISAQLVLEQWLPLDIAPVSPLALKVEYPKSPLALGAVVRAGVRIGWSGREPALMPTIEVPIPPGLELDPDRAEEMPHRVSIRNGRAVFQLERLNPGNLEVELVFRAVRAGRVTARSARAYLYYEPEISAQSSSTALRIE